MKKRMLDTHPTKVKFDKLCLYADKLGLSIEFDVGYVTLRDKKFPHEVMIQDLEQEHMNEVYSFPPVCEVKLVYEADQ